MRVRHLVFHPDARSDMGRAWLLVAQNDGRERADALAARIEAFCLGLSEFAEIGTRHDERFKGLRSVGVPGLRSVTLLFVVRSDVVTVIRIGYLGQNVWRDIPSPGNDNDKTSDAS